MRKIAAIALFGVLAGCASSNQGISLIMLEQPSYLRADRTLPQDFVQIQRAVFKHQAACNPEVKFSVDEMNPNFARVTKPYTPGATGWSHTVVLHLMFTKYLNSEGRVYSYYATTDNQVKDMFDIVLRPEYCPEKPELNVDLEEQGGAPTESR